MKSIHETQNLMVKPAKHGMFAYYMDDDPIGTCLFFYGEWAEQEFEVIKRLITPNTNCIDVGSNIGTHSVWLSKQCPGGYVFSIEPQFYIFQLLNTNIVLNDCFNVVPMNIGIANTTGQMLVKVSATAGVGHKQNYGEFSLLNQSNDQGVLIDIKKLDDLEYMGNEIGFMKIDCELLEAQVLISASNILKTSKPNMYIEFNSVNGNDEVLRILNEHDYNCYWHVYEKFNVDNFNKHPTNIYLDADCSKTVYYISKYFESNLIAIHKDKDEGLFTDKIEIGDNIAKWLLRHKLITL